MSGPTKSSANRCIDGSTTSLQKRALPTAIRDDYHIPKRGKKYDGQATNSYYVTNHYNSLQSLSKSDRKQSKIFYMRNFNNCIKSFIIKKYTDKIKEGKEMYIEKRKIHYRPVVLDLASGKGGDLLKWNIGRVGKVVCTDIAQTSVEDAEKRFRQMRRAMFDAEFFVCDASKEDLMPKFKDPSMKFDLCSCQFAIHYSFESEAQAERMIRNACQSLKNGGYFIGTTVNSLELKKRLHETDKMSFGNSLYKVIFESKEEFPKYGCRYIFQLDDVVDCPEFVLDKEIFVRICRKYGMKLLEWKTFEEMFWQHSRDGESYRLIKKMQALEPYNEEMKRRGLNSNLEGDYEHAEVELQHRMIKYDDPEFTPSVLTLSKSEWAVSSLYVAFAFVKDEGSSAAIDEKETRTSSSSAQHRREERIPLIVD